MLSDHKDQSSCSTIASTRVGAFAIARISEICYEPGYIRLNFNRDLIYSRGENEIWSLTSHLQSLLSTIATVQIFRMFGMKITIPSHSLR